MLFAFPRWLAGTTSTSTCNGNYGCRNEPVTHGSTEVSCTVMIAEREQKCAIRGDCEHKTQPIQGRKKNVFELLFLNKKQ